jgi:AcrR family transcriptional regulator
MPKRQAPSPWAPAAQRGQQRQIKRDAVLATAAQLFNERGFHATSLDDIAARLNVSKPTLYYYVKNKDEILIECVRNGLQMMTDGIEEKRKAGGKAIDQLIACIRIYTGIVTLDFGMCVIRISDDEMPAVNRAELRRLKSGIDMAFRRIITEGIAEGSFRPCDPKMAAFAVAGALGWIGRWYENGGDYNPEQIATQYIELLLNGILQPPTPSPG